MLKRWKQDVRSGMMGWLLVGISVCMTVAAWGDERTTARRFEAAKASTPELIAFLKEMPKGGDLHVHGGGAVYVEYALDNAIKKGLFYDPATNQFVKTAGAKTIPAADMLNGDNDDALAKFLDAASMRGWRPGTESGHDHFFNAFDYVSSASQGRSDFELTAEIVGRALAQHEQYIEIMSSVAPGSVYDAFKDLPDLGDADPAKLDAALKQLTPAIDALVKASHPYLDEKDAALAKDLHINGDISSPQSLITVRYIVTASRLAPDNNFFARLAGGMALSPVETMRSRIRKSVELGHARRIGHGISIAWEDDLPGLFKEMKEKGVGIEICLTSNATILGVAGADHPFALYHNNQIPVSLNTDDEGVARSNLTMEFVRAVQTYHLTYKEIKTLARTSLSNAFLAGDSLFQDTNCQHLRPEFTGVTRPDWEPSDSATRLLNTSDKMRVQLRLEQAFAQFEK